jgi:hypothetical protein
MPGTRLSGALEVCFMDSSSEPAAPSSAELDATTKAPWVEWSHAPRRLLAAALASET